MKGLQRSKNVFAPSRLKSLLYCRSGRRRSEYVSLRRSRRRMPRRRSAWPRNTFESKRDLKEKPPRKESESRKKKGV